MQNPSKKRRCSRRLADSSIWIAFHRIGRLNLLLSMPGIAAARCVVSELRIGTDDLAERITQQLGSDCFDIEFEDGMVASTLADVLQAKDNRLSRADALQVAYARVHSDSIVLYMRDGPAERQARGIGAPVRRHGTLVEHMVELGIVGEDKSAKLRVQLDAYFDRRRRRS